MPVFMTFPTMAGAARDQHGREPRSGSCAGVEPERDLQPLCVGHLGRLLQPGFGERGEQHGPGGQRHGGPLWGEQTVRLPKSHVKKKTKQNNCSPGGKEQSCVFGFSWELPFTTNISTQISGFTTS